MSFTTDQVSQIIHGYVTDNKSRNQLAREFGTADKCGTDGSAHILRVLKNNCVPIRGQKEAGKIKRAAVNLQIGEQVEQALGNPLHQLCVELSCIEISSQSGVPYNTLRWYLVKHNLTPLKTSQKAQQVRRGRKKVNDEELIELYVNKQLTMEQVADYFKITKGAVCLHCQRLGISRTFVETNNILKSRMSPEEREAKRLRNSERMSEIIATSTHKYSHTDIEMLFMGWCNERGFEYAHQHRIKGVRHVYDFLLPCANLIVEVDGDYWHSKPEQTIKDTSNQFLAETRGYKVIRFLRSEIKSTKSACFDRLLPLLCL